MIWRNKKEEEEEGEEGKWECGFLLLYFILVAGRKKGIGMYTPTDFLILVFYSPKFVFTNYDHVGKIVIGPLCFGSLTRGNPYIVACNAKFL